MGEIALDRASDGRGEFVGWAIDPATACRGGAMLPANAAREDVMAAPADARSRNLHAAVIAEVNEEERRGR